MMNKLLGADGLYGTISLWIAAPQRNLSVGPGDGGVKHNSPAAVGLWAALHIDFLHGNLCRFRCPYRATTLVMQSNIY